MVEIVLPANHADTTIEISSSTDLHVPRAAFVDSAGAPVTEPVVIEVQEILNPVETFLAGIPMALDSGRVLKSAGMFDIQGRTASGGGIGIRQDRPLELELASLDAGWYSQGLYFTFELEYAVDQYGQPDDDGHIAVLVCNVVVGNMYPVIESPHSGEPASLKGKPPVPKYDAHGVFVKEGLCEPRPLAEPPMNDELGCDENLMVEVPLATVMT